MKQLFEIKPNTPCYVNPKLPKFTVKIVKAGSSTTAKVDYDALYTAAYNKLTTAQQESVTKALAMKTIYTCYPCPNKDTNSTDQADWYNFVKYCAIKNDTASVDTFSLTWSGTSNNGTMTYTPSQDERVHALDAYNAYVKDNGAITGTKASCTTVDTTNWTSSDQRIKS
jgi:hypothetical protein